MDCIGFAFTSGLAHHGLLRSICSEQFISQWVTQLEIFGVWPSYFLLKGHVSQSNIDHHM